ncbi:hypothetical protein [Streptomyces sp. B21-083]|uniref:hypothetical protein n=1 Tax=Streptomyces sp. B21-083 TaxID=3039410 RepID=UPI002FF18F45
MSRQQIAEHSAGPAHYEDHNLSVISERSPSCSPPASIPPALPPRSPHSPPCSPPALHTPQPPGDTVALPVRHALHALTVQTENRTGYERSKFRHWADADRDSCNTRQEVFLEEAVTAPAQDANCALTGGSWYSPYDDTYFTQASALDIDHLVPLAESCPGSRLPMHVRHQLDRRQTRWNLAV